ncbi:MAG: decaprenyl-phosphate phosphoribosyltransferase [Acidobacteria bacterium]|nr:decaprenyl-phosphate phosphoribosyltransferase [Acidobacteriota bacterium]
MRSIEIDQPSSWTLRKNLRGLLVEMRPQEWVKNLLVFSGVIFSRSLFDLHDLWTGTLGFLVFCAASSGIYLFNDLCDIRSDRSHPIKCTRPLAAGELNVNAARFAMVTLFAAAALGSLALSPRFALIIVLYLAMCVAYSLQLKNVVILDVILIASGFVLRAISGAVLIDVSISEWLIICTSMVALLVGFGKRRHELTLLRSAASTHRKNLSEYSLRFLDSIMAICAGAALITYALYTRADETVARVGSQWMLITIPFVVYGVFRYLFLIYQRDAGGDPVKILFRDRPTVLNLLFWLIAASLVVYLPHLLGNG